MAVFPEKDVVGGNVRTALDAGEVPLAPRAGARLRVAVMERDAVGERVGEARAIPGIERQVEAGADARLVAEDAAAPVIVTAILVARKVDDLACAGVALCQDRHAWRAGPRERERDRGLNVDRVVHGREGADETDAVPVVGGRAAAALARRIRGQLL